jgi:hypothetical protein
MSAPGDARASPGAVDPIDTLQGLPHGSPFSFSEPTMTAASCEFDHLVVTAPTLEQGCAWVAQALGIEPGPGGSHPRMGTHNRLLRLGDAGFLEVIAIDPSAAPPGRPRWFGLDEPGASAAPRLATWVARTNALRAWPGELVAPLGAVERMTRGHREWLITMPADGSLPLQGCAPALIEWQSPPTSAAHDLPARGCALARLRLAHPDPDRLRALLQALGLGHAVDAVPAGTECPPGLTAWIDTPSGLRRLGADE